MSDIVTPRLEQKGDGFFYVVVRGCGWTMDTKEIHRLRDTLNEAAGDPKHTLAREEIAALKSEVRALRERELRQGEEKAGIMNLAAAVVDAYYESDEDEESQELLSNAIDALNEALPEKPASPIAGTGKPVLLECGRCPWNIHGVHDEVLHFGKSYYKGRPISEVVAEILTPPPAEVGE
jgi:hypothetical protein